MGDPHRRRSTATACPASSSTPKGDQFQKTEGFRATQLQNVPLEGHELLRNKSGRTPEDRIRDLALDGVDAEVLFPNKGLTIWATHDAEFSQAMCRVYNDWAWETFGPYNDRLVPMACVATADIDGRDRRDPALRGARLPGPVAAVQAGLRAAEPRGPELQPAASSSRCGTASRTSTCRSRSTSPPAATRAPPRSQGGAVINYAVHSLAPTMEPIDQHLRLGRRRAPSRRSRSAASRPASAGCRGR